VAITDTNPSLRPLGDDARGNATSGHDARPPSPRPRLGLPRREVWGDRRRHRTDDTPAWHTVQHLVSRLKAEHYNSDVQARLDAAERAS
jgi:hypothetical protein